MLMEINNMKKSLHDFSTSKFNKILRVLRNSVPDMLRKIKGSSLFF